MNQLSLSVVSDFSMAFTGGYTFKRFEGAAEAALGTVERPERIVLAPPRAEYGLVPVAEEGRTLKAGSPVFESESYRGLAIAAPVSGTVESVDGGRVTIRPSGPAGGIPGHPRSPRDMDRDELFSVFRSTGCALLLDRPILSAADAGAIRHVIVAAVHNGPLDQAWKPDVAGDVSLFAPGISALHALFPSAEIIIAANARNAGVIRPLLSGENARVQDLSGRYPQEHPALIARDAAGKTLILPDGGREPSLRIISFEDTITLAKTMTRGEPLGERVLPVAGPGVSRPGWYRIPLGATFGHLRKRLFRSEDNGPWRIVRGNLFEGSAVESDDEAVGVDDREIAVIREADSRELWRFMRPGLFWDSYSLTTVAEALPFMPKRLDSGAHGGVRPCVQCNYCDEVCPVGIYPHLIWKYVTAGRTEECFRFRPADCIGCGLCDYVCPSKIAISPSVVKAADAMRKAGRSDEAAD